MLLRQSHQHTLGLSPTDTGLLFPGRVLGLGCCHRRHGPPAGVGPAALPSCLPRSWPRSHRRTRFPSCL